VLTMPSLPKLTTPSISLPALPSFGFELPTCSCRFSSDRTKQLLVSGLILHSMALLLYMIAITTQHWTQIVSTNTRTLSQMIDVTIGIDNSSWTGTELRTYNVSESDVHTYSGLWMGVSHGRAFMVSSDSTCTLHVQGLELGTGTGTGTEIRNTLHWKDCVSLNAQRATAVVATLLTFLGVLFMGTSIHRGMDNGMKLYATANALAAIGSFFGMYMLF
jgi:hypothetical protein